MPWKDCEAVSEGNGPVHQGEEFEFGQPAPVDEFREIRSQFSKLKELMRRLEQHVTSLEHGARQPRLAIEADGQADTKTRERTEGPATAVQECLGIASLHAGLNPVQTPTRPVSA